jgi:hypothetical protein
VKRWHSIKWDGKMRIWKEAVMTYLKVLYWNMPGENE